MNIFSWNLHNELELSLKLYVYIFQLHFHEKFSKVETVWYPSRNLCLETTMSWDNNVLRQQCQWNIGVSQRIGYVGWMAVAAPSEYPYLCKTRTPHCCYDTKWLRIYKIIHKLKEYLQKTQTYEKKMFQEIRFSPHCDLNAFSSSNGPLDKRRCLLQTSLGHN